MSGMDKQKSAMKKGDSRANKCFFCDCKDQLKSFKNFFICQNCVNAANSISEERK